MQLRILGFCLLLSTSKLFALELATDKAAHFGLSSVATEISVKSCRAWQNPTNSLWFCPIASSSLVFSLGILKEIHDQKQGKSFDQADLAADVLGILTGQVLQWEF